MTKRTSFLTRFLAMALALVLCASNVMPGLALNASAASDVKTVSLGNLIADAYGVGGEAADLLRSGYLYGDRTVQYTVPDDGDDLVAVDTENKKITAKNFDDGTSKWVPVAARIESGETVIEVPLTNGEGAYDFAGNTFSVVVEYQMPLNLSADAEVMFTASKNLVAGLKNMKTAYDASDSSLGTIAEAMPALLKLAGGIDFYGLKVQLGEEAIAAVNALNAQITEKGSLNLAAKNGEYSASAYKTQYLIENGKAYAAEVASTYNYLRAISEDEYMNNDTADRVLELKDQEEGTNNHTLWMALKGIIKNVVSGLAPVASNDWVTENLVSPTVDYAKLDELATEVDVEVVDPCTYFNTQIRANMNMANVVVNVSMKSVAADSVGSEALVEVQAQTFTLTESKGASMADIKAEADAKAAEIAAAWGVENHVATYGALEGETLEEDVVYTVVYVPKDCKITTNYGADKTVPYGYSMELPVNSTAGKAYDYKVNGEAKNQGDVITITGDTTIERSEGKNYVDTDLYQVVSDNYGNESTKAILTSGALKGNETISYRAPDVNDSKALLSLEYPELTAKESYDASYMGQAWVPYTYGAEGTENKFGGSYTVNWTEDAAKVKYILNLSNFSKEQVAEILALPATLKAEATAQINVLNGLADNYETMGSLDKNKLGAMNGIIAVQDFTPGDGTDQDAENLQLIKDFQRVVNAIISGHLENSQLKIYNYLTEYLDKNSGGLKYYYNGDNAEIIIAEIDALAGYLGELVHEEEALKILCNAAGYPDVAEQINDLQGSLETVKRDLTPPNALIDTKSDKIGKLVDLLATEDTGDNKPAGVPYLESDTLTITDASKAFVQVKVVIGDKSEAYTSDIQRKGTELSAETLNALKDKVNKFVTETLGDKCKYYAPKGDSLPEAGTILENDLMLTQEYVIRNYTVEIEGEADQTVTCEDLEINLPKHAEPSKYRYEYTVKGEEGITSAIYTFELSDLDTLFEGGIYTIERKLIDLAEEQMKEDFGGSTEGGEEACEIVFENGEIIATMPGNQAGFVSFIKQLLLDKSYESLKFNDKHFAGVESTTNENGEEEFELTMSVQALVDALLNDDTFTNQTIIDLGKNGHGKLLKTTAKLEKKGVIAEYPLTMNLTSVPAEMATIAKGLEAVKGYMTFNSNKGVMDVNLDLPDAVYEAYLTAMIGTEELAKTNVNEMSHLVAYKFFNDYLQTLIDENVTATTYENTLNMLIKEANEANEALKDAVDGEGSAKDIPFVELSKYQDYYDIMAGLLRGGDEKFEITPNEENLEVYVKAYDNHIVTMLKKLLGIDLSEMNVELDGVELKVADMVTELKQGGSINATVRATLDKANEDYEAVIVNVAKTNSKKAFLNNIYDFTSDLSASAADMSGAAFIMLLDNVGTVENPANINLGCKTAIIDLNGKKITGSINYTGSKLVIMDSSRETVSGAGVTGAVSGNVTILAGNYPNANVNSMLPDGYYLDGKDVKNALYTVENGAEYTIDTDKLFDENYVEGYLPAVHYMAAEIALDMVLNHYSSAALSVVTEGDNYDIFAVAFDDLVGMVGSDSNKDKIANLVNDVLGMYRFENIGEEGKGGIDGFISKVVMQLTDFDAVRDAVKNGTVLAKYDFTTQPWLLNIKHVADGDYLTAGIVSNAEKAETITLSLKFAGKNKDKTLRVLDELAETVFVNDFMIDLHQPKFENDLLNVGGGAVTDITLDFSRNCDFNRMLAAIVAFAHEDLTKDFVKNGCIMDLNDILSEISVGDFFEAIKKAVEAKEWDFAALAAKANVELTDAQVAKLNEYYDKFQNGAGKVLAKLELKTDRFVPMSELLNPHAEIGTGVFVVDGYIEQHSADASYRGYGVQVNLDKVDVKLTVKLAPKCNGLWGDVNRDGRVNYRDSILILRYAADQITADQLHRCVADVSNDGKMNYRDSILILRYAADQIKKFPVEE